MSGRMTCLRLSTKVNGFSRMCKCMSGTNTLLCALLCCYNAGKDGSDEDCEELHSDGIACVD
jgi:hypothetical protein